MERFVCVNGSDNLQIPQELLAALSQVTPEEFQRDAQAMIFVADKMETDGWVRLPF